MKPHRTRRRAALGLIVAASLLAAACGGDDGNGTSAPDTTDDGATDDGATDDTTDDGTDPGTTDDGTTPGTDAPEVPDGDVEGTLVVAFEYDPTRIDPYYATNFAARSVSQAMFDTLVMNVDGEYVPTLAESFEVLDDQIIQFVLRDGITFHNGEVFDAEAVRYNVERMLSPETDSHHLPRFETIDDVEIVDDLTVNIVLSTPDAQIIDAFTHMFIVAPGHDQEVGLDGFEAAPVGTGPFTFVSYTSEDRTVVAANPDYWEGSPKGLPMVAQVEFRSIPEVTTRVAELNTGGAHIVYPLGSDQIPTVESAGRSIVTYDDFSIRLIQLNAANAGTLAAEATGPDATGFEALTDQRVRLAMNLAIDREAIVDAYLGGLGTPIGQPFAAGSFAGPADPPLYPYDPDRARELLAEAGYPDGLDLDIVVSTSHSADEITLVLGYLADVGITAERQALEAGVYNEGWTGGQFPHMRYASWGTPETVLGLMLETDALISPYSNADVDELIEQQRTTLDPAARSVVLDELTTLLHDDAAAIYLWSLEAIAGLDPSVNGWEPHPSHVPVTNTSLD